MRTNYFDVKQNIEVSNWQSAQAVIFGLLSNEYQVKITKEEEGFPFSRDKYTIAFTNPEFDGKKFRLKGNYRKGTLDGVPTTFVNQTFSINGWDNASPVAAKMLDNGYDLLISTDGFVASDWDAPYYVFEYDNEIKRGQIYLDEI